MHARRVIAFLTVAVASATSAGAFDCVEKKCSAMESCAEAYHHLTVCSEAKRDGDNDGIPCENVCGKTQQEFKRLLGPLPPPTPPPS